PFDHIHPDDALEHEVTSAPVHLHFADSSADNAPAIAPLTADDDEVDVLWRAARTANIAVPVYAVLTAWGVPIEPAGPREFVEIPQHRAHDPPSFHSLIPRAPPA